MTTSTSSPSNAAPGPSTPGGELEQIAPFPWPVTTTKTGPTAANTPDQVGSDDSVYSAAEALRDNWERVKDSLKRQFGELSDQDLNDVACVEEAVIDHIREKTGRERTEIAEALQAAVKTSAKKNGDRTKR